MKVSKSSWHYRLIKGFSENEPVPCTLCEYVLVLGLCLFVVTFWACCALASISMGILLAWLSIEHFGWVKVLEFSLGVPIAGVVIVYVLFVAAHAYDELSNSMPLEWLRAKKDKVCPTIEFTE